MMKPETKFRIYKVYPFLKKLPMCEYSSIQQLAIIGDPDTFICIRGVFIGAELKSEDGVATPLQQFKLSSIVASGGIGMVISPKNWEPAKKYLQDLSDGILPKYRHFGFIPLKINKVKPVVLRRKKYDRVKL